LCSPISDRHLLASSVQKDGHPILHCEGQGPSGTGRSPQDRHLHGSHLSQPRGQDQLEQGCRGLQDQLQRTLRRDEKAQWRRCLGRQVTGSHCQAREGQGSRARPEGCQLILFCINRIK